MGDLGILTVRTRACDDGKVHITEATHVHPSGALITVWSKHADVDGDWCSSNSTGKSPLGKVHEVTFCRVAATLDSSCALEETLGGDTSGMSRGDSKKWLNGDDGIWVAGGWAWQGLALLEGCVRSGKAAAEGIGARGDCM